MSPSLPRCWLGKLSHKRRGYETERVHVSHQSRSPLPGIFCQRFMLSKIDWLAGHVRKRQFREICPTPVPKVFFTNWSCKKRCKAAAAPTSPDICSQIGSDTGRFTILMEIHKAIRPPLEKCSSVLALPGEFALRAISGPVCMRRFMSPESVPY